MRPILLRRRAFILIVAGAPLLASFAYVLIFRVRNEHIVDDWSEWVDHLSGPPSSWQEPSNELRRFYAAPLNEGTSLCGYKSKEGSVVIQARFSPCAERFYDGLAWAWDPAEQRSGYINPDGSWAILLSHGSTHFDFVGGMGKFQIVGDDGYPMYGFVNRQGEVVVPAKYRAASWYVDGYVLVHERTWIGKLADRIGKEIGVFPATGLDTRAIILDNVGREVPLPSR